MMSLGMTIIRLRFMKRRFRMNWYTTFPITITTKLYEYYRENNCIRMHDIIT